MAGLTVTTRETDASRHGIGEHGSSDRPRTRRVPAPGRVLALASLGAFAALLDATIVNVAFPSIQRSFPGASASQLSWVLSAYNLTFAAFVVAGGRIADLLGRRRTFSLALGGFTVASALCAAAPSVPVLIATRVLQALFSALLLPSSRGLVLASYPVERRAHAVATWTAVSAAAAGIGPPLGALLVSASGWRLVFLVNIPVGIAGIVMVSRQLVESRAPGRRRAPDLGSSFAFAAATGLLVLGIIQSQDWGWGSARVVAAFALAVALMAAFVWRCRHAADPLIDLDLFRNRAFSTASGMMLVSSVGFYGVLLSSVLFLTEVWRYPILEAGLALTPGPLLAIVVSSVATPIRARLGLRPVLALGALVWAGSAIWLSERIGADPDFLTGWLPAMLLFGLGAGLMVPSMGAASVASMPGANFASSSAINTVARQVGAALGVALTVTILGTPTPETVVAAFHDAWWLAAGSFAAAGLGALVVGRLRPVTGEPTDDGAVRAAIPPSAFSPPRVPHRASPLTLAFERGGARSRPESVADFLRRVPMLASLPVEALESLAERARSITVTADEWLFRQGDQANGVFVVRSGRIEVIDDGPPPTVLRQLGRADVIGELSLLTQERRSASARAARHSVLIVIDASDLEAMLNESPGIYQGIAIAMASQLRESRAAPMARRPVPRTIAVVSSDPTRPAPPVAGALVAALNRHGRVALLDGTEADAPIAPDHGPAIFGPLLSRSEAANDQVVLSAGDALTPTAWTHYCLQEADRILLLTTGGSPPPGLGTLAALGGCDLVGLGLEPGCRRLAGWCDALDVTATHTLEHEADGAGLDRLARRLTGNSVGVVLSGGGARALAHIGVLEELTKAGIVIDRVAGVGLGAYIGALFATGHTAEEIDARCYEEWVRNKPLGDYTLSRHALLRGERMAHMLRRSFGEVSIEELGVGFSCASADLLTGELVVSSHGPLAEALKASMTLPLLSPPVARDGRMLVDGSLLDSLPVALVSQLGEGPVIAVRVESSLRPPGSDEAAREPALPEILSRVLALASASIAASQPREPELLITVTGTDVGLLEFHLIDTARQAGRRAARARLESLV